MSTSVRVGVAVVTIGRPELALLLDDLARSSTLPAMVVVANNSPQPLPYRASDYPFPLTVLEHGGWCTSGRNAAIALMAGAVDVVAFPNDDSRVSPQLVADVAETFERAGRPAAMAGSLMDPEGIRYALVDGEELDRRTVWRAVEPAMFVALDDLVGAGGFDAAIGTGAPSPWQSGDGTDLLLRVLARGGRVVACPGLLVRGAGERRQLGPDEVVAKHRRYARGTGHVYRLHRYPWPDRVRIVLAPWVKVAQHDRRLALSVRIARARSLGRLEGLLGRVPRGTAT